ncbi:MAG: glycoside hydrolase family 3 C-terminal domain-containing protein [Armatimonadetes bacterium]|nr:glycoside hydrolase family 3 C-terminal domain-containing protein [Armatimonadota bacterium]
MSTSPASPQVRSHLKAMNLDEKIAQISAPLGWLAYEKTGDEVTLSERGQEWLRKGVGGLYGVLRADPWTGVTAITGLTPERGRNLADQIFKYAQNNSPHGLPPFLIAEANHGYMALDATIAPSSLMASCTWNPALWKKMMECASAEAISQGNHVVFCPNIDLLRDPRWGRCEETLGEDPYLAGEFARAAVEGLQGENLQLAAVAKHFVHGSPQRGLNTNGASMGRHDLFNLYVRVFRKAIDAGVAGIMPSYNEIDGVPCSGNRWLLTEILRDKLEFDGVTFSDVGALGMLSDVYRICQDHPSAAATSLAAGMDFETSYKLLFDSPLKSAIKAGALDEAVLDQAVIRVLMLKERLGMLEPQARSLPKPEIMGCLAHQEVSYQVAVEGAVLLKNENSALPLGTGMKIAVVGPQGDSAYGQLGDYTPPQRPGQTITLLAGMRSVFGEENVLDGCFSGIRNPAYDVALRAAEQADTVVLAIGGSSARDFDDQFSQPNAPDQGAMTSESMSAHSDCGEGVDRCTLEPLGYQIELTKRLAELGKPIICVLTSGRPLVLDQILSHVDALLFAPYIGQQGGRALADLIAGNQSPSGRLSFSWPRSIGQLPIAYNMRPTAAPGYIDGSAEPKFEFGFGLSYTEVQHSEPEVVEISEAGVLIEVTVENCGERAGSCVTQVYLQDKVCSIVRPEKELCGFAKTCLEPGASKRVQILIERECFGFYNANGDWVFEPGEFIMFVGQSSLQLLQPIHIELR